MSPCKCTWVPQKGSQDFRKIVPLAENAFKFPADNLKHTVHSEITATWEIQIPEILLLAGGFRQKWPFVGTLWEGLWLWVCLVYDISVQQWMHSLLHTKTIKILNQSFITPQLFKQIIANLKWSLSKVLILHTCTELTVFNVYLSLYSAVDTTNIHSQTFKHWGHDQRWAYWFCSSACYCTVPDMDERMEC